MPATYEPIATNTLGSAAASITFSSIPQTYTDLQLIVVTPTGTGDYIELRFNGSSATNYSWTIVGGDGASPFSQRGSTLTQVRIGTSMGSTTYPTYAIADIFSYTGSTYKSLVSKSGNDRNGSGEVRNYIGLWRSTNAITSVLIKGDSGLNLAAGTTATLYGIKAA
jgi:hypothetical protein